MTVMQPGFTPAYAGKIYCFSRKYHERKVHPRIRGEDQQNTPRGKPPRGSPPHTRGRFGLVLVFVYVVGFTPAYAGKIGVSAHNKILLKVHPRIRGEDRSEEN